MNKQENTNYDLTGTFSETRFKVLRYWASTNLTKAQIGDIFNLSEGWADKEIGFIYKTLKVHTRQGSVNEAWKKDILTKLNCEVYLP